MEQQREKMAFFLRFVSLPMKSKTKRTGGEDEKKKKDFGETNGVVHRREYIEIELLPWNRIHARG